MLVLLPHGSCYAQPAQNLKLLNIRKICLKQRRRKLLIITSEQSCRDHMVAQGLLDHGPHKLVRSLKGDTYLTY